MSSADHLRWCMKCRRHEWPGIVPGMVSRAERQDSTGMREPVGFCIIHLQVPMLVSARWSEGASPRLPRCAVMAPGAFPAIAAS